jgi:hypothetical protein
MRCTWPIPVWVRAWSVPQKYCSGKNLRLAWWSFPDEHGYATNLCLDRCSSHREERTTHLSGQLQTYVVMLRLSNELPNQPPGLGGRPTTKKQTNKQTNMVVKFSSQIQNPDTTTPLALDPRRRDRSHPTLAWRHWQGHFVNHFNLIKYHWNWWFEKSSLFLLNFVSSEQTQFLSAWFTQPLQ